MPGCEHYFANGVLHHNSGKTWLNIRTIIMRALGAPKSRHAVLRFRFNHVKMSIIFDTLPNVMETCFPDVAAGSHLDKTDWFYRLPNGSEIFFGGLDDKERTEKILGQGHSTIFLNECSQIPWASRVIAVTRLSQKVMTLKGEPLRLKMLYDCNPPTEGHWTHKLFIKKRSPDTNLPIGDPENYASLQINPKDNEANLPKETLEELASLPARQRQRFWLGQWGSASENALWTLELIEQQRVAEAELPDMQRVLVAVDPSGCSGPEDKRSDEVGIVVVGLGVDGKGYVLEDLSGRHGPAEWGRIAVSAFERNAADAVVAEVNFGGAMVQEVVRSAAAQARVSVPFRAVTASRGKVVRAEPVAVLFEQQKVWFVGNFPELEDQCCSMTTAGYTGGKSPDRLDAMVWGLSAMFPALSKREDAFPRQPQVVLGYAEAKRRRVGR